MEQGEGEEKLLADVQSRGRAQGDRQRRARRQWPKLVAPLSSTEVTYVRFASLYAYSLSSNGMCASIYSLLVPLLGVADLHLIHSDL